MYCVHDTERKEKKVTEQRTPDGWQKKKAYSIEYAKTKYKRIPLDVPIDFYDRVKTAADRIGEPVNVYIKKAIETRLNETPEPMTREDILKLTEGTRELIRQKRIELGIDPDSQP